MRACVLACVSDNDISYRIKCHSLANLSPLSTTCNVSNYKEIWNLLLISGTDDICLINRRKGTRTENYCS